jgi:hypothetical protein
VAGTTEDDPSSQAAVELERPFEGKPWPVPGGCVVAPFEGFLVRRHVMEARKFAIGDQVRLRLDSYANDNPADVYTVSRALPATANVWQYRVKRVGDGQERAVNELQLEKAASQTSAQRSVAEMQQDTQRIRNTRASERARAVARRSEQERH